MRDRRHSTCRLCANRCPILVDVEEGRAVQVGGDPDAPLYRGYSCRRGRLLPQLLNDPSRLLRPMKRLPDGSFAPISSEQALDEVTAAVERLAAEHGPRSIALYCGTQSVQSPPAYGMGRSLLEELGSPMLFSANTIDQPGKHVAAGLHGYWMAPAQAFDRPEVVLWIGINPLMSYKGIPAGVPRDLLREVEERGGYTITVDPRRTETARLSSLHLQSAPGEDVAVVAGLLHVILAEELYDRGFVAENVDGLAALTAAVRPFTPDYVAHRAGIAAEDIVTAARWFGTARRGYAVAGTGGNMSAARGTLLEYLILALDTICGHYLREGEVVAATGPLAPRPTFRAQASPPVPAYGFGETMRATGRRDSLAGLPTADLADEILFEGEGRVRALFNLGGNPVVAFPGQERTVRSMDALDLLVSFDVRMSQTARRSHYVFASTMCLEIPGIQTASSATVGYANGYTGHSASWAQYTPAVVERPPGSDLLEEWEVFFEIAKRLGLQISWVPRSPFRIGPPAQSQQPLPKLDMSRRPTHDEIIELWTQRARVPLETVKGHPHGGIFDPGEPVAVLPREEGWQGRLSVGNAEMMHALADYRGGDAGQARDGLRLLNRRMIQVNSSYNLDRINRGITNNPLFMNPEDMAILGLADDDEVDVASGAGEVRALVKSDASVMTGTASMAHCFGDAPDTDLDVRVSGTAVSRLNAADFPRDPYTGQPQMANIRITVHPVGPPRHTAAGRTRGN
ncbi:molybdopterin-dependent oxidoreductase [Streptomyces iranensis]|uniref:molybdopterin-containing oxidoreductase family protein n=1 Tax=Streptomyces iranensis TaxID=576784 RepID=UPI0039B74300